jgi:ABC-2 type transport system permease protein
MTNLKAAAALRGKFWLQVTFMMINNVTWFVFWWVLFKRIGSLRSWQVDDVVLLYGLCAAAFGLMQGFTGGVRHISRWIDEGELDPLLVQPKSTWLYAVCSRSQPTGFGDVISGSAFILGSGHVHAHNLLLAVLCTLCGACVFLGVALTLYSLAFWFRRSEAISRQSLDFLVMFGMYPEALFQGPLLWCLFTLLPAGFVSYVPVHILRDGRLEELPLLIAAAVGFMVLGIATFERGLRRYASGSRFGVWG